MYKKILVPLDGSELAECVLPHVNDIAKGCNVPTVIFLRVVQPFQPYAAGEWVPSAEDIKRVESQNRQLAEEYLTKLAKGTKYNGSKIETQIINNVQTAEAISDYATKNNIDLIVIATHGRSGVSRWVWGSVADRILRSACVPVLMVRAPGCIAGI
ncbi:MAG: universal stress protein [Dehalococcoidales bacterium]|nr:universal stress protein [Dehalococcoidales bacterium]